MEVLVNSSVMACEEGAQVIFLREWLQEHEQLVQQKAAEIYIGEEYTAPNELWNEIKPALMQSYQGIKILIGPFYIYFYFLYFWIVCSMSKFGK